MGNRANTLEYKMHLGCYMSLIRSYPVTIQRRGAADGTLAGEEKSKGIKSKTNVKKSYGETI